MFLIGSSIILSLLFYTYINLKYAKRAFYFMPLVMLMMEIFKEIFESAGIEEGLNTVQALNLIMYSVHGLVFALHKDSKFKFNLLFIVLLNLYFFKVSAFRGEGFNILSRFLSFFFLTLFFYITYIITESAKDVELFKKNLKNCVLIFIGYVTLASIFRFGPNMYNTGVIYGFQYAQWYTGSLLITLIPFINQNNKNKNFYFIAALIIGVILTLVLRRTNLIIIILTFGMYVFLNKKTVKTWLQIMLGIFGLAVVISIVIISGIYQARQDRFSSDYDVEDELRYIEWFSVNETISHGKNNLMTGTSAFLSDDRDKYGLPSKYAWRPILGTYARVLWGSGYIGLSLFGVILLMPVISMYKRKLGMKSDTKFVNLGISIMCTYIIVASTGASGLNIGVSYVVTVFSAAGVLFATAKKDYDKPPDNRRITRRRHLQLQEGNIV